MTNFIDCDSLASALRTKILDIDAKKVFISRLSGSEQERDLTLPPNCGGFGRIRHFRRNADPDWVPDPLPNDPACQALGIEQQDLTQAQVFQIAGCNLRCWYCFVPLDLRTGNKNCGDWFTVGDLLDRYMLEPLQSKVIDFSGGEPSLTPELIVWFMKELRQRQLDHAVYLWSDDNLSNDFFWRFISEEDQELVSKYAKYGKVCCFKGFSAESFSFNTHVSPHLYDRQFDLMSRWLHTGIDLYAYCTFTAPHDQDIADAMARFVDRLQSLSPNLPLRTVPLKVTSAFTPVRSELTSPIKLAAIEHQWKAIEAWKFEIDHRFSSAERALRITEVSLKTG